MSIWKTDIPGEAYTGPSFHDSATGADSVVYYRASEGVRIFLELPHDTGRESEFSYQELRRLHRTLGRLLDKVAAEPKPADE